MWTRNRERVRRRTTIPSQTKSWTRGLLAALGHPSSKAVTAAATWHFGQAATILAYRDTRDSKDHSGPRASNVDPLRCLRTAPTEVLGLQALQLRDSLAVLRWGRKLGSPVGILSATAPIVPATFLASCSPAIMAHPFSDAITLFRVLKSEVALDPSPESFFERLRLDALELSCDFVPCVALPQHLEHLSDVGALVLLDPAFDQFDQ